MSWVWQNRGRWQSGWRRWLQHWWLWECIGLCNIQPRGSQGRFAQASQKGQQLTVSQGLLLLLLHISRRSVPWWVDLDWFSGCKTKIRNTTMRVWTWGYQLGEYRHSQKRVTLPQYPIHDWCVDNHGSQCDHHLLRTDIHGCHWGACVGLCHHYESVRQEQHSKSYSIQCWC